LFRFNFNQFLFYRFAHGNEKDGFKMFEEKFLRETIRNFPYKQCPLLQQLVRQIAPISLVSFILILLFFSHHLIYGCLNEAPLSD